MTKKCTSRMWSVEGLQIGLYEVVIHSKKGVHPEVIEAERYKGEVYGKKIRDFTMSTTSAMSFRGTS